MEIVPRYTGKCCGGKVCKLHFSVRSTDVEKRRTWLVMKRLVLRIVARSPWGLIQDIGFDVGLAANMLESILASAVNAIVAR
jgi:hypothetical protein